MICHVNVAVKNSSRGQLRWVLGFSLPEVTIAVGIAALGLVALLGLLPQGLEMARRTGELAVRRQIVEDILRDFEQASWRDLDATSSQGVRSRFYDDQGTVVNSGSPTMTYVASVEVTGAGAAAVQLPQGGGASPLGGESYLRRVTIKIANTSNAQFDFDDRKNAGNVTVFNNYIAKSR